MYNLVIFLFVVSGQIPMMSNLVTFLTTFFAKIAPTSADDITAIRTLEAVKWAFCG